MYFLTCVLEKYMVSRRLERSFWFLAADRRKKNNNLKTQLEIVVEVELTVLIIITMILTMIA